MSWKVYWVRLRERLRAFRASYNEFHCDKEFFVGIDVCVAVGKIRLKSEDRRLQRLWEWFRVGMLVVFALLGWRFYQDVVKGEMEFVKVVNNLFICSILGITTVRSVLIGWQYDVVGEVRCFVNGRDFLRDDVEAIEIRRRAYFVVKNLAVVILTNLVVFLSGPSLLIDVEAFRLPFEIPDWEWGTFVCQKVHVLMLVTVGVNFVTNFLLIFMVLFGLIAEMKVLDRGFSRVFDQALNRRDECSSVRLGEEFFWKELNARFDKCIYQHTVLLEKIVVMRDLFESTFLVMFYSTAVHIAGGAFFLTSSIKSFDAYMLQMMNVLAFQIIECLVLTRWTTELNAAHESIGETVYNLGWPQELQYSARFDAQYRAVRAKIWLTMERCNQPLRFSRGQHFEFTQEKFTELMNDSYTLVTFLWDMRH